MQLFLAKLKIEFFSGNHFFPCINVIILYDSTGMNWTMLHAFYKLRRIEIVSKLEEKKTIRVLTCYITHIPMNEQKRAHSIFLCFCACYNTCSYDRNMFLCMIAFNRLSASLFMKRGISRNALSSACCMISWKIPWKNILEKYHGKSHGKTPWKNSLHKFTEMRQGCHAFVLCSWENGRN